MNKFGAIFVSLVTSSILVACSPGQKGGPGIPVLSGEHEDAFQPRLLGNKDFGLSGTKTVVLTFDDGPSKFTMDLLRVLRQENVPAAFFVIGQNIKGDPRHPETNREAEMRQTRADGHIIANHTFSHIKLRTSPWKDQPELASSEILKTHDEIAPYLQPTQRLYFRPPVGGWLGIYASVLNQNSTLKRYIGPIFWTIGGETLPKDGPWQSSQIQSAADWHCWDNSIPASVCAEGYVRETEKFKGGVILMHNTDARSTELAELVIQELKRRGYSFTTLDALRSLDRYE